MRIHNRKNKIKTRREFRKESTPQEIILWSRIKNNKLGCRFRRQHSIGKYIVDFYCSKNKLVIEIDGYQHKDKNNLEYDKKRTEYFNNLDMKVLRFWNNEINKNIEGVIYKIEEYLK